MVLKWIVKCAFAFIIFTSSSILVAAPQGPLDLTASNIGLLALVLFAIAYALVIAEEYLHLRKSKPVLVAAGLIWFLIGYYYTQHGLTQAGEHAFRHNLMEYAELMLFLLVAMTYVNALEERGVFDALRAWMLRQGFTLRGVFWITGLLAFFISPIADNLTTALLMCAVVLKVAQNNRAFIGIACINIVVAANAGGAFSPFGDITTLMVWQAQKAQFTEFFYLFIPSVVNYLIPALCMSFAIPNTASQVQFEQVRMKRGAKRILCLFILTITTAVTCHSVFHLPPVLGMMTGLGYLQLFGFYLQKTLPRTLVQQRAQAELEGNTEELNRLGSVVPFDVFNKIARAEWDTLLFFYGVVMCVGGLGFMGYLALVSNTLYTGWDPTYANILVGILSAIVDNIPVMFAVLSMDLDMSLGQWLLVTLTAGVGGSLLSIGSAAGVALMGQAKGMYTFFQHLRWSPVIFVSYIASIAVHLWLNKSLM